MKECPSCKSKYRKRLKRKGLQKLLINIKVYKCFYCKSEYIFTNILGPILLKKGKIKAFSSFLILLHINII
jgi:hypothetical protein